MSFMGKTSLLGLLGLLLLAVGGSACRRDHRIRHAAAEDRRAADRAATRAKVYERCADKRPEGTACGLIANGFFERRAIDSFVYNRCGNAVTDACRSAFVTEWTDRLLKRYYAADLDWVLRHCKKYPAPCDEPTYYERVWLTSHNKGISASLKNKQAAINKTESAALAASRARQELAARRAIGALAAGAKGYSDGLSGRSSPTVVVVAPGCQFDVECGVGRRCLKGPNSLTGTCATLVDEYKTPSFDPRDEPARCQHANDCAAGFECVGTFCRR